MQLCKDSLQLFHQWEKKVIGFIAEDMVFELFQEKQRNNSAFDITNCSVASTNTAYKGTTKFPQAQSFHRREC